MSDLDTLMQEMEQRVKSSVEFQHVKDEFYPAFEQEEDHDMAQENQFSPRVALLFGFIVILFFLFLYGVYSFGHIVWRVITSL